jgi:hypothetical protein
MHGACCVIDTASKWEIHLQNGFAMQKKIKNACCVNNTACTVIAVSLTPHAEYNTTCTIDERFVWPWQPLNGLSIKNVYVRELSYKYQIYRGYLTKNVNDTACSIFAFENRSCLGEFEAEFKKA